VCYNNIQHCIKELSVANNNTEKAKSLAKFQRSFTSIQNALQESEWAPTKQMMNAVKETVAAFNKFYGKKMGAK
jgi:23S rRNA C2498 (ribose-2'-O)-methylase RlmM